MFSGIVERMGRVVDRTAIGSGCRLVIDAGPLAERQRVGDSVAVDGVCLTVVERRGELLGFDLSPETLARTTLGERVAGDAVNLEPALRAGDPIGGHFVQGHVDGVGVLEQREPQGDYERLWFRVPEPLTAEMVRKGSVAVDGVSLTIVELEADRFSVALIPHTLRVTTLGSKPVGARVNIETDVIGKYVVRVLRELRVARGGGGDG